MLNFWLQCISAQYRIVDNTGKLPVTQVGLADDELRDMGTHPQKQAREQHMASMKTCFPQ